MRVLLVNPAAGYFISSNTVFNPLGLLSIGSYLESIGHEVKLLDRCVSNESPLKVLEKFQPDVIGVSILSSKGLRDAIHISKLFKKRGYPVIWGGSTPSMIPEIVLKEDYVDYVIIGEGEYTFEELLEAIRQQRPLHAIKGLGYKCDGNIVITDERPFIDLAKLPITDYSLIDVKKYLVPYLTCKKLMFIYSSKGCPCRCTFCINPCYHRSTFRKRPNEIVIAEIKYLIEHFGMDGVYFSDELWCADKREMYDFCRRVQEENLRFHWFILTRVGLFTKEDLQLMYECGCRGVFFGIETGSKETMKKIHKDLNYEKIVPYFESIKDIGITYVASFIIGYPEETVEQLRDTVQLIQDLDIISLTPIFHLTPLPGTVLYQEVVQSGKYTPLKNLKECMRVTPTISVGTNLSAVPTVDLRVIRSRLTWRSFSRKDAIAEQKPFEFIKVTIINGLRSISQKGFVSFFIDGFKAFTEFVYIFWFAHAYPNIRKKYGLK